MSRLESTLPPSPAVRERGLPETLRPSAALAHGPAVAIIMMRVIDDGWMMGIIMSYGVSGELDLVLVA